MKLSVRHSVLGDGWLTDENPASSYGQPVFVREEDGEPYGPGDIGGYISRAPGIAYSAQEQEWLDGILSVPESPVKWRNPPWRPLGSVKAEYKRLYPRTIRISNAEWGYCLSQGSASEYIRALIARDRQAIDLLPQ